MHSTLQRILYWQTQLHVLRQQERQAQAFLARQRFERGLGDGAFGIAPSPEDAQDPDYMAGYERGKECW